MNKTFKKLMYTGLSALMLAGIGVATSTAAKPAHASMPDPELFHSTRYRDNVYYAYPHLTHNNKPYFTYHYGQMPQLMKKRGYIFQLYYGKKFYNEYVKYDPNETLYKAIYRHGVKYFPAYTGYAETGSGKGQAYEVFINQRDVGKPYRNQNKALAYASDHNDMFSKPVRYLPLRSYHVARYHHFTRRHGHRY